MITQTSSLLLRRTPHLPNSRVKWVLRAAARRSLINLIDLAKASQHTGGKKLYDSTIFKHIFHYQRHYCPLYSTSTMFADILPVQFHYYRHEKGANLAKTPNYLFPFYKTNTNSSENSLIDQTVFDFKFQ